MQHSEIKDDQVYLNDTALTNELLQEFHPTTLPCLWSKAFQQYIPVKFHMQFKKKKKAGMESLCKCTCGGLFLVSLSNDCWTNKAFYFFCLTSKNIQHSIHESLECFSGCCSNAEGQEMCLSSYLLSAHTTQNRHTTK